MSLAVFNQALDALSLTPAGAGLLPFRALTEVALFVRDLTRSGNYFPEGIYALTAAGHDPLTVAQLAASFEQKYGHREGAMRFLAFAYESGGRFNDLKARPVVDAWLQREPPHNGGIPDDHRDRNPAYQQALYLVPVLAGDENSGRYALGRLAYEAGLVRFPNQVTVEHLRALRRALGV